MPLDDQNVESFATGLSQAISGYMGTKLSNNLEVQKQGQLNALNKNPAEGSRDLLAPEMAEKISPGLGQLVQNYNKQNPNSPLTMKGGLEWAKTVSNALSPDTSKENAHQDQLEKQATDRLTQVRGDQSVLKTETQRDAAAMAYETIVKAQSEGRHLSSVEYNDLAAQLWKARTGSSVTTEELKKIAPSTAQASSDHFAAWASGNPNLIGATSIDTENNLKQFVADSGNMADKQHEAYMAPRMVKPTGLNQDRWDRIAATGRGLSFGAQKQVSDTSHSVKKSVVTPQSVRAKLGL